MDFDEAVLCGDVAFSIVVLLPKNLYSKNFSFSVNLFQSLSNENVQGFQWLSYKIIPVSYMESFLKIPSTIS